LLCNTFPKFIGSLIAVSKDVQENKEPIFCGMGEAAPQKNWFFIKSQNPKCKSPNLCLVWIAYVSAHYRSQIKI
jgi:hypothetical protein